MNASCQSVVRVPTAVSIAVSIVGIGFMAASAPAQQILDRATLNDLLGDNIVTDDFETYSIANGEAVGLGVSYLNHQTIVKGQGPDLVSEWAAYVDPSHHQLQWNGDGFLGLSTKTLSVNGTAGAIEIEYEPVCSAMGIDVCSYLGSPFDGTVEIFARTGELVGTVYVSLGDGDRVFAGWQHDEGIARVRVYSIQYPWSPVIDDNTYGNTGLKLTTEGTCPGVMRLTAVGAGSNALVGFAYGMYPGRKNVPGCPGQYVDIGRAKKAGVARADIDGVAVLQGKPPAAACGRVIVQAVDLDACRVSNIVGI